MEAEAVEEYGEWIHMDLMGYSSEELYEAAGRMTAWFGKEKLYGLYLQAMLRKWTTAKR